MRRFDPASRYGRVAHRKSGGFQTRIREGSIPSSPAIIAKDVDNVTPDQFANSFGSWHQQRLGNGLRGGLQAFDLCRGQCRVWVDEECDQASFWHDCARETQTFW